ncbi:putative transmembrane channel-like protein 3 [Penaeus vannamei]|uniref:Putative transmembrane channel-like protein 3 n=1 Tax=Penaeus vannamei TaxID=6689 RepID=A0A3R7LSK8_PENVA|nr:putative transmembrane channel-like protein 3 [Penaeus vannamei]
MSGAGDEEEGGGKSPRSRSPAMGVSGLLRDHQNKLLRNISTHDEALLLQAGSEDEGRRGSAPGGPGTGILRLDPAKPRRSSAASVEFKTDKDDPSSPCPSDRLSVTWADGERSVSSDGVSLAPRTPVSSDQPSINTLIPACGSLMEEPAEDDEFCASVSAILKRTESRTSRRGSRRRKKMRRTSTMTSTEVRSWTWRASGGDPQDPQGGPGGGEAPALAHWQEAPSRAIGSLLHPASRGGAGGAPRPEHQHQGFLLRYFIRARRVVRAGARAVYVWVRGIEPWQGRIKTIESYFGSAVASYFTFLRWVLGLNIALTAFLTAFVIIPEFLASDRSKAGERKSLLPDEVISAYDFKVMWDFEGILRYSPIFYGYYSKTPKTREGYRLPLAYFLTSVAVYAYSFVAILRKMAANSRMSKLADDDESTFTWKVLGGWDFTIGNPEAAQNKVASINTGLREALLEAKESEKEDKSWKVKAKRFLAHLIVLGLVVASAYAVVLLVERSKDVDDSSSWYRQNELTIILTLISLIYPNLFDLVGLLEERHPRNQLQWQLARIMALNLLNLYTLIFALFSKVYEMTGELGELKENLTDSYGDGATTAMDSLVGTTSASPLSHSDPYGWPSASQGASNFSVFDSPNASLYELTLAPLTNASDTAFFNLTTTSAVDPYSLVTTLSSTLLAAITFTESPVPDTTVPRCRRIKVPCSTTTSTQSPTTSLLFEVNSTSTTGSDPQAENVTWTNYGPENVTWTDYGPELSTLLTDDPLVATNGSLTGPGNGTVLRVDDDGFPYDEYYVDDKVYVYLDYLNNTGDVPEGRKESERVDPWNSSVPGEFYEEPTAMNLHDITSTVETTDVSDDMEEPPGTTVVSDNMEEPPGTTVVSDNMEEPLRTTEPPSLLEDPGVTEDPKNLAFRELLRKFPSLPGLSPILLGDVTDFEDDTAKENDADAGGELANDRVIIRRAITESGEDPNIHGIRDKRSAAMGDYGGLSPVDVSYLPTFERDVVPYDDYADPMSSPSEEYNTSNYSSLLNGTDLNEGNFTFDDERTSAVTTVAPARRNTMTTYWDKLLALFTTSTTNNKDTTTEATMENNTTESDEEVYLTSTTPGTTGIHRDLPLLNPSTHQYPNPYHQPTRPLPHPPIHRSPHQPHPTPATPTTESTTLVTSTETTTTIPAVVTTPFLDQPMKNNPEKWAKHLPTPARHRLRKLCWETMFGQEIIKLTVMDLVVTVVTIVIGDYIRAVVVRLFNGCCCWDLEKKFPGYPDFKIAENILHLVNNQGMIWMGMFFSPGLPALNTLKLVIVLYVRSWAVVTSNVPPETVFKASNNNNFYLLFLLTMLFLCTLPVGYAVVWLEPSWHCGPFSDFPRMYKLATYTLIGGLPSSLYPVVDYISSPGVVIPAGLLLVLIIYYLLSLTAALREANCDLRDQLRQERSAEKRKALDARTGKGRSETPTTRWGRVVPLTPMPRQRLDGTSGPDKTAVTKPSAAEPDGPPALPPAETPRGKDEGPWPDDVTDLGHSEVFDDSLSDSRKQGKDTPVKEKPVEPKHEHKRHEKEKDKMLERDYESAPRSPYSRSKHRHNSYPQGARDEDKARVRRENHRAAPGQSRSSRKSQERKHSDESSHRESPTKAKSGYRHGIVDSPRSRRRKGSSGQAGKLKDKMPEECMHELNEVIHQKDMKKKKSPKPSEKVDHHQTSVETEAASRAGPQSRHRREPSIFKMDDIRRNSNEKAKNGTQAGQRRSSSDDSQSMQSIPVIKISKEDSVERSLQQARLERQAKTMEEDSDSASQPLTGTVVPKPAERKSKPKPIETDLDAALADPGTTCDTAALLEGHSEVTPDTPGKDSKAKDEVEPADPISSDDEATLLDNN